MDAKSKIASAFAALVLSAAGLIAILPSSGVHRSDTRTVADSGSEPRAVAHYGQLPISFEPNVGQASGGVEYLARGRGFSLQLRPDAAVLQMRGQSSAELDISPADGAQRASISGEYPLEGKINYLVGVDTSKHRTGVPTYSRVRYHDVYPGIDWVFYGNPQSLEYDFVVAPGRDPKQIKLDYAGAESLSIDNAGDLIINLRGGAIVQRKPVAYQDIKGEHHPIEVKYRLESDRQVAFEVAAYDASQELVIDPVLAYSTYLGGGRDDRAFAITVDNSGSAYVAGFTFSPDFNTKGAIESDADGDSSSEAFISKLSPRGDSLVYSTYLGGANGDDYARAIAVDSSGSAYVAGYTYSTDFNTVNPIEGNSNGNDPDAFVAKLSPDGSSLIYSTYLGGANPDFANAIAVDSAGSAYVAGTTLSTDFDTANPIESNAGGADAFIAKLVPAGNNLVYATYLGGGDTDEANGIAVDGFGNAYVAGSTRSSDFNVVDSIDVCAPTSAFVSKLSSAGVLVYSSCLNGSLGGSNNSAVGAAVDGFGNAYVAGSTFKSAGGFTAFVAKLNTTGNELVYTDTLGGSDFDAANAIAVDSAGRAWVAGHTLSTDFNSANAIPGEGDSASGDAFIANFDVYGNLVYSTYLGGNGDDSANGIAVDAFGNAYVAGYTLSTDFDTLNPIEFDNPEGASAGTPADAFITKLAPFAVQFGAPAVEVSEGGAQVSLQVLRSGAGTGQVSVDYTTASGTATAGSDFVATSGTLTWADSDDNAKTITINIVDEGIPEADETFSVTLSNPTANAVIGADATAVVTIPANDPAGQLAFNPAVYSASSTDTSVTLSVTRVEGNNGAVTVQYSAPSVGLNGMLDFADGETVKTFTGPIPANLHADTSYQVVLSTPTGGAQLGSASIATVNIKAAASGNGGGGALDWRVLVILAVLGSTALLTRSYRSLTSTSELRW